MAAGKPEIIAELQDSRAAVIQHLTALPAERHDEPFLGEWSVRDLQAHLIGWDYTNADAVRSLIAGTLPDFFSRWDPDWRSYNAELVRLHLRDRLPDLIDDAARSHEELIKLLERTPAREFTMDRGVRAPAGFVVTISNLLETQVGDEREHFRQMDVLFP
jgi:hypothetical protein